MHCNLRNHFQDGKGKPRNSNDGLMNVAALFI